VKQETKDGWLLFVWATLLATCCAMAYCEMVSS
jgi:hypothetical protein